MLEGTISDVQKNLVRQTRCREKAQVDLILVNVFAVEAHYSLNKLDIFGNLFDKIGTVGKNKVVHRLVTIAETTKILATHLAVVIFFYVYVLPELTGGFVW